MGPAFAGPSIVSCPGRDAMRSIASQNRDRSKLGVWYGPGSAERRKERRTASVAQFAGASWFETSLRASSP
jgi:hypothetical protein